MKKFIGKPIPEGLTYEEESKIDRENAIAGFKVLEENIPEIREIFKAQLDKPGHPYRAVLVEEIMKYLVSSRIDKFKMAEENDYIYFDYLYAVTIYELADIIEAVNKNDEAAFVQAMEALPWGDSNTGDQISWNNARFAYGIMSDEAREKFGGLFAGFIARSNVGRTSPEEHIAKMANLEYLPQLMEYNMEVESEIKAKKPGQPGDC